MAFRITCPGCKTAMKLDDDMRGRKVRCENCDKTLNIPGSNGKKPKDDDAVQEGRKLKNTAAKADEDEPQDEEQDEERPAKKKKKKKKKKSSSMGLLIGGGAAIVVLLIAVVGASAYILTRSPNPVRPAPNNEQLAKNNDKKAGDGGAGDKQPEIKLPPPEQFQPGKEERLEDRERKKGGKSIIGNVRGAGYRTERKNELRQIGLFFQQYAEAAPKSARTKQGFMDYMKRDSKVIWDAIDDGYYTINVKADHTAANSIIAYETDIDRQGYLAVRGDLSVDYITQQELNAALGK